MLDNRTLQSILILVICLDALVSGQSCYICNGQYYRGTANVTKSGRTCQRWDTGTPHNQWYTSIYPDLRGAENYCRNPDGNDLGPYCFTTDPNKQWETCDIERCTYPNSKEKPDDMEFTTECYVDDGRMYRGNVAVTDSGKQCVDWCSRKHNYTPHKLPCSGLEENFCRNPYSSRRYRPWCFTAEDGRSWEYCNITKCGSITVQPPEPPRTFDSQAMQKKMDSIFPNDPADCFTCNGFFYRGEANTTVGGRTCQRWDSDTPHKLTGWHRQLNRDKNYCRTDLDKIRPWCYTTDPDKRWEFCDIKQCTNADGSLVVPNVKYQTGCSYRSGQTYRGQVNVTYTGRTCAKWGSHSPRTQHWTPEKFPCSGLEENYCRQPGVYFQSFQPWCYTTDPDMEWEHCNIPYCDYEGNVINTPSQLPAQCGVSTIDPVFSSQPYEIKDGKIVKSNNVARIIKGEVVQRGTWPWLVKLQFHGGGAICGGTLIHESWVLSAVHCVHSKDPLDYVAIAGYHKGPMDSLVQGRTIKRHFLYEEKIDGAAHDVALLQMDTPFVINDYVRPACLPEPDYQLPFGTFCIAAGWGDTRDPTYTGGLKQVVVQTSDCGNIIYVCTGSIGTDEGVCFGDSGGPLMCLENDRWVNYGIAVFLYGCNSKDSRNGWANVSKYVGWINKIIEDYNQA